MRPAPVERTLTSRGVEDQAAFALSLENSAAIMGMLRNQMYTDSILAVIREYSSNAWDVHVEQGLADTPIKVQLPTQMEPAFSVRDYGVGLSTEEVLHLYTQYGMSTKRDADVAVGMLGIGAKSAFSYSDTFQVSSWHKGTKKVYIAVMDEKDIGAMNLMHEEPCGDETGLEVSIPIKVEDVSAFETRAIEFYKYFDPMPVINNDAVKSYKEDLPATAVVFDEGFINCTKPFRFRYYTPSSWTCVMGCVPYRFDPQPYLETIDPQDKLSAMLRTGGVLYCDIGSVEVAASREELKYTEHTLNALSKQLHSLYAEYVKHALAQLDDDTQTPWEQRVAVARLLGHVVSSKHGKALADKYSDFARNSFSMETLLANTNLNSLGGIAVAEDTVLYLRDISTQAANRKKIGGNAIVSARSTSAEALKAARVTLDDVLKKQKLTGIPIKLLSEAEDSAYRGYNVRAQPTEEQRAMYSSAATAFVYKHEARASMNSERWEKVVRVPTDEDVFIRISRFEPVYVPDTKIVSFRTFTEDKEICEFLGLDMPPIYGYKVTAKNELKDEDCVGTPYREWHAKLHKKALADPSVREQRAALALTQYRRQLLYEFNYEYRTAPTVRVPKEEILPLIERCLGTEHEVYKLASDILDPPSMSKELPAVLRHVTLDEAAEDAVNSPSARLRAIKKHYPLIAYFRMAFMRDPEMLEYIHLKDADLEEEGETNE